MTLKDVFPIPVDKLKRCSSKKLAATSNGNASDSLRVQVLVNNLLNKIEKMHSDACEERSTWVCQPQGQLKIKLVFNRDKAQEKVIQVESEIEKDSTLELHDSYSNETNITFFDTQSSETRNFSFDDKDCQTFEFHFDQERTNQMDNTNAQAQQINAWRMPGSTDPMISYSPLEKSTPQLEEEEQQLRKKREMEHQTFESSKKQKISLTTDLSHLVTLFADV